MSTEQSRPLWDKAGLVQCRRTLTTLQRECVFQWLNIFFFNFIANFSNHTGGKKKKINQQIVLILNMQACLWDD